MLAGEILTLVPESTQRKQFLHRHINEPGSLPSLPAFRRLLIST
jgi:hypothetical protein